MGMAWRTPVNRRPRIDALAEEACRTKKTMIGLR
jgi:hypothetical protein